MKVDVFTFLQNINDELRMELWGQSTWAELSSAWGIWEWRICKDPLLGNMHGSSPWSLRTAPICILLISERKHMCWGVESTLDLALTQPSEEGNGDPGPFSEEMPAQPLGTLPLLHMDSPRVNYSCKISTAGSQCCTVVSFRVCLQGLSWPLFLLPGQAGGGECPSEALALEHTLSAVHSSLLQSGQGHDRMQTVKLHSPPGQCVWLSPPQVYFLTAVFKTKWWKWLMPLASEGWWNSVVSSHCFGKTTLFKQTGNDFKVMNWKQGKAKITILQ